MLTPYSRVSRKLKTTETLGLNTDVVENMEPESLWFSYYLDLVAFNATSLLSRGSVKNCT